MEDITAHLTFKGSLGLSLTVAEQVKQFLEKEGFSTSIGESDICITGSKCLYESLFQATLNEEPHRQKIGPVTRETPCYSFASDPTIPDPIKEYIDGIVFSVPPDYFS